MNNSIAPPSAMEQRQRLSEVKPEMLRMGIDLRHGIGLAIQRAVSVAGWTNKEAAAHIWPDREIDAAQSQLSKWIAGTERPHFDALYRVPELRWPLIESQALMLSDVCEVVSGFYRRIA